MARDQELGGTRSAGCAPRHEAADKALDDLRCCECSLLHVSMQSCGGAHQCQKSQERRQRLSLLGRASSADTWPGVERRCGGGGWWLAGCTCNGDQAGLPAGLGPQACSSHICATTCTSGGELQQWQRRAAKLPLA